MPFLADNLGNRVPLVVGIIIVLLLLNTALQYASAPSLEHALPLHEGRQLIQAAASQDQQQQAGSRVVPHDSIADVAPGGADAELLCVDKQPGCEASMCGVLAAKYQQCKFTCNSCDRLRSALQDETGLQIRVVQQLSPCLDLHPTCQAWVKQGRCNKEPKSMLDLCQASCSFCLPPSAKTVVAGNTSSSSSSSDGNSRNSSAAGGDSSSSLLDECQDELSVCPFLAAQGLCSNGSLWVETQCERSCSQCSPAAPLPGSKPSGGGAKTAGSDASSSGSSTGAGSSTQSSPASSQAAVDEDIQEVESPSPTVSPLQLPLAQSKASSLKLYGSHEAFSSRPKSFSSEQLKEWPVPGCHDQNDRCSAWAADSECNKNADYMNVICKDSCNNCKHYTSSRPFQTVQLNNGRAMPAVGFGTAGLGVGTAAAVQFAVAAGYRMFDSAESRDWYLEEDVGTGLAASKAPREQLFLTSKLHPRDHGFNSTLAAFSRALGHLKTDYLDLFLLHYPNCFPGANCISKPKQRWQDSWKALEQLNKQGKARSIGVSNFGLSEMQELLALATIKPAVLETRSDPFAINHHLINFCLQHNITFIAYSTLGTQWINSPASVNPVFASDVLKDVAARHPGKSVVQVVLRWSLQLGQIVIPRSAAPSHISENLQLFDFELSDIEMQAINSLDGTWKTGGLPFPVA